MAESLSQSLHTVRIPQPPSPLNPLRSPKRRQLPADDDPLLGKLSPEAILDALAAINAVPKHERQAKDLLVRSISQVSSEDQALGARAAIAAKKLREWLKEVQAWQWPKGAGIQQGKGFVSPPDATPNAGIEFLGSLPASIVGDYESRLDAIHEGMESLHVDELKEHIMNVHIPGRSRPSSAHSALSSISAPPFTHMQLSDFTAVITATILRALPTLARLNMLLDTWSVRLLVLRQIPGLLHSLDTARASLDIALRSADDPLLQTPFSAMELDSKKEELAHLVRTAGSLMDTVLDALEGREDSIPEIWIDNMDALEADFTTWVQRAEKLVIERQWRTSAPKEALQSVVEEHKVQQDPPGDNRAPPPIKEQNSEDPESLCAPTPVETSNNMQHVKALVEDRVSSSELDQPLGVPESCVTFKDSIPTPIPEEEEETVEAPSAITLDDNTTVKQNIPSKQFSSAEPLLPSPVSSTSQHTVEIHQEDFSTDPLVHIPEMTLAHEQLFNDADVNIGSKNQAPIDEAALALETNRESTPESTGPQLNHQKLEQSKNPLVTVTNDKSADYNSTIQQGTVLFTPGHENDLAYDRSEESSSPEGKSELVDSSVATSSPVQDIALPDSLIDNSPGHSGTEASEAPGSSGHVSPPQGTFTLQPIIKSSCDSIGTATEITDTQAIADISIPDIVDNGAHRLPLQPRNPNLMKAKSQLQEEQINSKNILGNSIPEESRTPHQRTGPPLIPGGPLDPDVPVQSIESSSEQIVRFNSIENPEIQNHSRQSSFGPPHGSTEPFSPPLISSASDRTVRETNSPQLNSSLLQDLQAFQNTKNASLPLQRFIDDESDANYPIHHDIHSDSSSSREELSDTLQEVPRFRRRSESPPPNAIPRRAVRGPSSRLMRGTISSLNKVVGTRDPSNSSVYEAPPERLSSRHRLGSPYEVETDSSPWRRKSSVTDLLQAPKSHLHTKPSMESISSYVSSNGTGRRRYSFSTDGGSFAIRPVNEADSDLQEKIHTILTGIPGSKIRLSNKPAKDFDQQSMISSISSSKRSRITARSPFSTPSRAGTPTPSEGFSSSSRQRRMTSHKTEDKTVRVYHLHHRGKTEPTKLFVRTVGEEGERVMVRVGGGWADLGEYLREYVLHHGRQTPSSGNVVEVKGLSTTSPSPKSTTSAATAVRISNTSPGQATISERPGSSLSVRKTRRTSRPSELPELAINAAEFAPGNLPLPPLPLNRRTSISSINSVSVSSMIGDGSNVYSPYPGSARTPHAHSVSTPLGLAGPKPRTRHVSMTPESEAWVEDVIGQARRTSSNVKSTNRHIDHPLTIDREAIDSSRTSIRSISDISSVGRNKRVSLKGLGTHDRL